MRVREPFLRDELHSERAKLKLRVVKRIAVHRNWLPSDTALESAHEHVTLTRDADPYFGYSGTRWGAGGRTAGGCAA